MPKTWRKIDLLKKLRSKKWPHPETGNTVEFDSLPAEEQTKLLDQAKEVQEGESSKKTSPVRDDDVREESVPEDLDPAATESLELSPEDRKEVEGLLEALAKEDAKKLKNLPKELLAPIQRYVLNRKKGVDDPERKKREAELGKQIADYGESVKKGLLAGLESLGLEAATANVQELRHQLGDAKNRKEFADAFIKDAPPAVKQLGPPSFLVFMVQHILESMLEWAGPFEGHESAMDKQERHAKYVKDFAMAKEEGLSAEDDLAVAKSELDKLGKRSEDNAEEWDSSYAKLISAKKELNKAMQELVELNEERILGPGKQLEDRQEDRKLHQTRRDREKHKEDLPFTTMEEAVTELERKLKDAEPVNEELEREMEAWKQLGVRPNVTAQPKDPGEEPEDEAEKEVWKKATAEMEAWEEEQEKIQEWDAQKAKVAEQRRILDSILKGEKPLDKNKPKTDKSKTDKTKTDKPKTDKPKTDKSKTDKSKTDKSKTDKSKTDEDNELKLVLNDSQFWGPNKDAAFAVVKKHKLFQGDVDAIREIAQDRKGALVKKPAEELLVRFRRRMDSEMKDRMQDVTAEEFEKMLDALDSNRSAKTSRKRTAKDTAGLDQFLVDVQESLKRPSDEILVKTLASMAKETEKTMPTDTEKTVPKKSSLEQVWFRKKGLAQVAPTQSAKRNTAEKYFFDNPEKRETREFAQAGTLDNSSKKEQSEGAPPTVKDIEKTTPGSVAVSTLSRFLIQTEEPVSRTAPQGREDIPKHPKLASNLEKLWFRKEVHS